MSVNISISYEECMAYWRGTAHRTVSERIAQLREQNPIYDIFFNSLGDASGAMTLAGEAAKNIDTSFDSVDELLLRLLADSDHAALKFNLRQSILNSPLFYERLMLKLEQADWLLDKKMSNQIPFVPAQAPAEVMAAAGLINHEPPAASGIRPWWQYSGIAAAILLLVVSLPFLFPEQNPLDHYQFATSLPYDPGVSSFRGSTEPDKLRFIPDALRRSFDIGLADYLGNDYASAIAEFTKYSQEFDGYLSQVYDMTATPSTVAREGSVAMENHFIPLSDQTATIVCDHAIYIRNYFFYRGLSQLAEARLQEKNAASETKLLGDALISLRKANGLNTAFNLDNPEVEATRFFMGIVHGMSAQPDSAIDFLGNIGQNSQYYDESLQLIRFMKSD